MNSVAGYFIDLPPLAAILLKVTALLALSWGAHGILLRANPRWRALLWRVTLVAAITLPAIQWGLPRLEVAVADTPEEISPPDAILAPTNNPITPYPVQPMETKFPAPQAEGDPEPSTYSVLTWAYGYRAQAGIGVWLGIALLLLYRTLRAWRRVHRLVASTIPAPDDATAEAERIAQALEVRANFEVRVADKLGSPFVTWLWRSVVVLPERCIAQSDAAHLRAVLAHELAHIKTRDPQWMAFARFVTSLLWFHPLVWRLQAAHGAACEEVCDGVAAEYLGSRESYSQTLAREALAILDMDPAPGGVPMLRSSETLGRLRKIQRGIHAHPLARHWIAMGVAIAVVMVSVLGSIRLVQADPLPAPSEEDVAEVGDKGEISGVVTDEEGNPLSGALVDAWTSYKGDETRTEADGRFTLRGLGDLASVELRVSMDGFAPYHNPREPLGGSPARIVLDDDTYFEGTVKRADGSPAADTLVRTDTGPVQAEAGLITSVWTETRTDANGRYRLRVAPGEHDLQVTHPSGEVFRRRIEIEADRPRTVRIRLEEGVAFRARVFELAEPGDTGEDVRERKPAAGLRLYSWRHKGLEGFSNEAGEIVIEGLLPGGFEFDVESDRYARWWSPHVTETWEQLTVREDGWQRNFDDLTFELAPGMEPVTIIVEPAVTITGTVKDPNGDLVPGATVSAARTGTGNSLTGDTRFSVETEDDGTFSIHLPASNAAQYNLVAHDGDYGEWRQWANGVAEPLQTQPGDRLDGMDLVLNHGGTVRGRVVDREGQPLADADVRAAPADMLGDRYYFPQTTTQADGTFELGFIRPGDHHIQVEPFWLLPTEAPEPSTAEVTVVAGETVRGVSLTQVTLDELNGLHGPQPPPSPTFKPGDVPPDFTAETVTGETLMLYDYRGKIVLLDFWATWCGPCIGEVPNLLDTYATYKDRDFEIIGVSLDEHRKNLIAFLEQMPGITWPHVFDGAGWKNAVAQQYGVNAIPYTLLLDSEGVIQGVNLRGEELKQAVGALVESAG